MIKPITLLFVLTGLLSGCSDIYYESETRLVVEGRLVDKNGQPVPAQYIDVLVTESDFDGGFSDDVITYGKSDAAGAFRFVIPAPDNIGNFINLRINPYGSNTYQTKQFMRIGRDNFNDYRYNLHTIVVYKMEEIADLGITTEQTDQAHFLENLTVVGNLADSTIEINPMPMDFVPDYYQFEVAKNQTVGLKYTVADYTDPNHPVRTDYNIPIAIDSNDSVSYTLTY